MLVQAQYLVSVIVIMLLYLVVGVNEFTYNTQIFFSYMFVLVMYG